MPAPKPAQPRLFVLTAMINPYKTMHLWRSWRRQSAPAAAAAGRDWEGRIVVNGPHGQEDTQEGVVAELARLAGGEGRIQQFGETLGVVPAFKAGLDSIEDLEEGDLVALFHDDLRIDEPEWDEKVKEFFASHPKAALAGFGGAYGVGSAGMYEKEFDPMTLARHHFMSNMQQAEAHGERVHTARPVAVLDGFSLIARAGLAVDALAVLSRRKVVHHVYDCAVGCEARRQGLQTWLLPYQVHHHGGLSATSSAYGDWAKKKFGEAGDQAVWLHAHRQVWEEYRDVLPFDVREG